MRSVNYDQVKTIFQQQQKSSFFYERSKHFIICSGQRNAFVLQFYLSRVCTLFFFDNGKP